jgi:hypothetical protein
MKIASILILTLVERKTKNNGLVYKKQMVDLVRNGCLPCLSNFYEHLLF